jgi:nitrate reductase NapAB chaperone NapD
MTICSGVVIDVLPGSAAAALHALQGRPGIPVIEGPVSAGRLVAVLEAEDNRSMDALVEEILATAGIISLSPAYIHFDAEEEPRHV